jgi:hypothetical protein
MFFGVRYITKKITLCNMFVSLNAKELNQIICTYISVNTYE